MNKSKFLTVIILIFFMIVSSIIGYNIVYADCQ